ncbi:TetR family transcriptional regulator [Luteococcus peritonei]
MDLVWPAQEVTLETPVDGRTARWERHRVERRRELVAATLRAIRRHGAGVGMDEIAAAAGTSKTVIYRHFGDRTGLYTAVVEWVHDYILTNLEVPLRQAKTEPARLVAELTDTYLGLVQRDPEIYRFVVSRPLADVPVADPVGSFTTRLGDRVAEAMAEHLVRSGQDPQASLTWGHGVVGFVWAVADKWLSTGMVRPRPEIVAYVDALFTPAFSTAGAPHQP